MPGQTLPLIWHSSQTTVPTFSWTTGSGTAQKPGLILKLRYRDKDDGNIEKKLAGEEYERKASVLLSLSSTIY